MAPGSGVLPRGDNYPPAGCTRSAGDGLDKGYLGYTLRCWADTLIELVVVAVESRFNT